MSSKREYIDNIVITEVRYRTTTIGVLLNLRGSRLLPGCGVAGRFNFRKLRRRHNHSHRFLDSYRAIAYSRVRFLVDKTC